MAESVKVPWVNWSGSQKIHAQRVEHPTSLAALREIVRDVSARSGRMKAVATGLSFSDILQSDDTLVETTGILGEADAGALLPLEEELWRASVPASPLIRVACGARIRALNGALARAGLAFTNLGGYDGQTLIGAISTSTHGSGLRLPPLSDGVRSLDLITTDGALFRIEPANGLTDPAKFAKRYGGVMTLVQSDHWFWPVVVSMGCMGIIYSVTLSVSPAYRLHEVRRVRLWSEVVRELLTLAPLRQFRNYEVEINPYRRRDGDYSCLVTERNVAPPDVRTNPVPSGQRSAESITFLASSQAAVLKLMIKEPRLIPGILETGLAALETQGAAHVDDSFRVYNVGEINTADVVSGEYFFPLRDCAFLKGIQRLLDTVERNRSLGIYQPTPLSVRFVAGSKAPLSMARSEPHCTVEIALFSGTPGASKALLNYEQACLDFGGRPHWGQINELTGKPGWLREAYPGLDVWLRAYERLNTRGIFNNHFTDRLGLSMPLRVRP